MRSFAMFVLLAAATAACDTEEDLCDAQCDCEGCSDRQYDDCLHGYEVHFNQADRAGCLDLYDEWVDCRDATYYCNRDDKLETDCGPEKHRLDECVD